MILYHGTNASIGQIELARSRAGKDFGVGFYLTPDRDVAYRQAERKLEQYGVGENRVYEYFVDEEAMMKLNVLSFDGYTLEWAKFVLMNRKNRTKEQAHDFDVVSGPIADDVIGYQIRRVEEGIIDVSRFMEEIKYHTVTMQYLFATEKSIKMLKKL